MMLKIVVVSLLIMIFGCDNNECSNELLTKQENKLKEYSKLICTKKPKLIKLLETDNFVIDTDLKNKIDFLFDNFCIELLTKKEFEIFSVAYWYNFKYNQLLCCSESRIDIIPHDFLEIDYLTSKSVNIMTLHFLLDKNQIKKSTIRNGFTITNLSFPKSIESLKEYNYIISFIKKVDSLEHQLIDKSKNHTFLEGGFEKPLKGAMSN